MLKSRARIKHSFKKIYIMDKEKTIHAYKGFDKDLKCRGFQYEVGKEYKKDGEIGLCQNGFHACWFPFDVFSYYDPGNTNRYCAVTQSGVMRGALDDSKVASQKIRIDSEIGVEGIVKAGIEFILDKVDFDGKENYDSEECSVVANALAHSAATNIGRQSGALESGDYSSASCSGEYSAAVNVGDRSVASNTALNSVAANTGYYSAAINEGECSAATNTGYYSAATNKGIYSVAVNSGNNSVALNSGLNAGSVNIGEDSAATAVGDFSVALNMGKQSIAKVSGKQSIAIVTGVCSKAAGALGDWIVLTERGEWNGDTFSIKEVKAFKVDGDKIKADTFYKLVDGEAVEV